MSASDKDGDGVFEARVGLGLREIDGVEEAPDVSDAVLRRLHANEPERARTPLRWWAVAAALLAIGVTATLLVQGNRGGRAGDPVSGDPAPVVSPQDPMVPSGPWRLVYELPMDELQRSLRDDRDEGLEQVLARAERNLQRRVGEAAEVRRDGGTFTVAFDAAAGGDVARVRSLLENPGRLEMRIVADADYVAPGVQFDMAKERAKLQAWLDGGGRERLQRDPGAIAEHRTISEHVRWFVRRVRPDAKQPGFWSWRYRDIPSFAESVVAAHADHDWNEGVIPVHIQALPDEQQFLVELALVNMHEVHFDETDVDPTSIRQAKDQDGCPAVAYSLRGDKASAYADFSEKHVNKCCAMIWNDELFAAPKFMSRIPGVGWITGFREAEANETAAILSTPLPAALRLLRSEPNTGR